MLGQIQADFLRCALDQKCPSDDFIGLLKPTKCLSPNQQLGIYQRSILGALQAALEHQFPVIQKILGAGYFRQLSGEYIKRYPSQSADLNQYGQFFQAFMMDQLSQRQELIDFLYLGDLAWLEWHYHRAYYVNNDLDFDFEAFAFKVQQLNLTHISFVLSEAVFCQTSEYPVHGIWRSNQNSDNASELSALSEPLSMLIYRQEGLVKCRDMDAKNGAFIERVAQGANLAELADYFSEDLDGFLTQAIQQKWISSFTIAGHYV